MKLLSSLPFLYVLRCDASACEISNVTHHFAARQRGAYKHLPNSLLEVSPYRNNWERSRSDDGAKRDCFLRCSAAPPFPTVTVTETSWDRLWPRLAGLEGVSAASPGTSWHRVPTRSAAAAA
ncbi:hypothetical protein VZT92_008287 [Zoarces viviparus]